MFEFIGSCLLAYLVFAALDRLFRRKQKPFPDLAPGQFIVQADDRNFYIVQDAPKQEAPTPGKPELRLIK